MTPRPDPALPVPPPAVLARWQVRVLLAAVLLVPFFVPIPRDLQTHPVISELGDRLHVILLGGTAFFLYWYGPLRGRLLAAAVAAAAVGGLIELLQTLVGRHALWHDFFQDLIGIGIVFGFLLWRGRGSRPGFLLMAVLVLLIPFQMRHIPATVRAIRLCGDHFPLLADFEDPREDVLWGTDYGAALSFVETGVPRGRVLRLAAGPSRQWPAVDIHRFPADWSAYSRLRLDVRLVRAEADTVAGGVILSDFESIGKSVWKTASFRFTRQWRTVAIDLTDTWLEEAGRDLDLEDIFGLRVYLSQPPENLELELDNIRLE